jgi:adenylate kinase family enzyme
MNNSREKEPVTVKILEDTNCNESAKDEWLVERLTSNTVHCRGEQQRNDNNPESN